MSFFAELKRRNVVRVGIAYAVTAWLLAQVAEFAFETFAAPEWALRTFVIFLALGLPIALIFAWAFELTPEGLKLEKHVDRSQSITPQTGRKLDFVIIGVLVVAVAFLLVDKFLLSTRDVASEEIVATESQSIAVLPFVNMSDDADHFADGLSEALLNLLAKVPDLKVAARTSSFAFKGRNQDLREVGEVLGVKTVLEGSVQRAGERLRVTAQLINVDDGFHIWSETYDRQMADIFDIQDDVSSQITDALKLHLAPASDKPTDSPEAYALYLEALAQVENPDYQSVIDILDRAIRIDPQFAKAYELKANAYWVASGVFLRSSEAQLLVHEAASRAYELDPSLVLAKAFSETAHPQTWSWSNDLKAIEEALRAEPDNVQILFVLSYDLAMAGYFEEALEIAHRIIELDPLSPSSHWAVIDNSIALGRLADARAAIDDFADAGFADEATRRRAALHFVAGEYDEGIAALGDVTIYDMNGETLREFIEQATDPASGREFLHDWIGDIESSQASNFEKTLAKIWFLYLGYLDDYWQVIIDATPESPSSWTNAEQLEYVGVVFHATGFRRHPNYIPYARKYGMLDVWDARGAPNYCSKSDGEWACE